MGGPPIVVKPFKYYASFHYTMIMGKRVHPGRLTWNIQITQFRKENHLPNLHEDMFHINLPGCIQTKPTQSYKLLTNSYKFSRVTSQFTQELCALPSCFSPKDTQPTSVTRGFWSFSCNGSWKDSFGWKVVGNHSHPIHGTGIFAYMNGWFLW